MSFLAMLSIVGCVCPPAYYTGMHPSYLPNHIPFDSGCDPCGAVGSCDAVGNCGIPEYGEFVEFGGDFCAPRHKIVDCRTSFSNLSNGAALMGRGILDVTAAPFVIVANMLSSGCQYELIKICDTGFYGHSFYQSADPCCSARTSGCDTCAGGYTEGIQYNQNFQQHTRMLPAPARRNSSVIQASYQEPTAPAVKFVQPRHTVIR